MYKLITAFCLSIVLSIAVFAQTNSDEYNKNEFYVGYSNQQIKDFQRKSFNGIEVSYTRNVHRYVGIRGTVSYARNNRSFGGTLNDPTVVNYSFLQQNNRSIYNFLGGVQFKDNASKRRLKPFAFALAGVAHNRSRFEGLACVSSNAISNCPATVPIVNNQTFTDTGFSGAFGGGLDIKINDRIDFRAIQFDYNPVYTNTRVENNYRFGIGIVIK